MEIILREYQSIGMRLLRSAIKAGIKRLVMVAPTGAGKTIMFCYMAVGAVEKRKRVLVLTDRAELMSQADGAMSKFNMKPIKISANKRLGSLNGVLYIGMVETLSRRLKEPMYIHFLANLDLIILDECHKQAFNKIFPFIAEKTIVIGATATPYRESTMVAMDDFYQHLEEVCKVSTLILDGFLCKPRSFRVPVNLSKIAIKGGEYDQGQMGAMYTEMKVYVGVYENYMKHCPGKKALMFASTISSSIELCREMAKNGIPCRHIDSTMIDADRTSALAWFKVTPGACLSNVGILNTGFDEPTIEVVILYRATKSLPLFLQMCGRGSRTTPTKSEFFILDFGNNFERHGLWQHDRNWSLKKKEKGEGVAPVKSCPTCDAMLRISQMVCPECGYIFISKPKDDQEEFTILEEIVTIYDRLSPQQIKNRLSQWTAQDLINIENEKGYAKSWAFLQLRTITQFKEFAKIKGFTDAWVDSWIKIKKIKEETAA